MKSIDVKSEHLDIVKSILREHLSNKARVLVFGSRVTGKAQPFSDLDLAIDAGHTLSLEEMAMLNDQFEQSTLPYKVDVIDWYNIDEAFKKLIQADCISLLL